MSTAAPLQNLAAKTQPLSTSTHAGFLLQRKCACGSPTSSLTGDCAECKSNKHLQAKLAIGASNDPLEQEADRVADQVLAAPANPAVSGAPPHIQRFTGQPSAPTGTAPASVDRVLASPGRPLEPALRQDMEQRFGHDFSRVRVHSGAAAEQSAQDVNANAYAVRHNLVFGAGLYAPGTNEGRRLIAHELTHVVQQGGASASGSSQLQLNPPGDRVEHGAVRVADAVMTRFKKGLPRSVDTNGLNRLSVKPPSLQRTAKFVQGTSSEDVNPAEQIAENKIPDGELFLGQTNFVLNKITFLGGTKARNALHAPDIGSAKRTDRGMDCWFSSVPDNVGSYDMKVLKKGSWTHVTDKKNVAGRFPTLKACKNGFGDVTFVVRANNDLRKKVETHEKHHADDYEAIFNNVLVPWDVKVTDAHKNGKKMAAIDGSVCEKRLYLASVGKNQTPDDIVSSITNDINTRADAFHNSPAGNKPNVSIVDVDSDCNVVKAKAG